MNAVVIIENPFIPTGRVALQRKGKIVWVGPLGAPWEDADCDTIIVSAADYAEIKLRTLPDGRAVP